MPTNNLNRPFLNGAIFILFLTFAAVQYNDPDPVRWIAVYAFVALVYGMAVFGKFNKLVTWAGLAFIVFWMGIWVPEFLNWIKIGSPNIAGQMKAETPYVEFTREFLGLLLAGLALAWQIYQFRKK